MGKVTSLEEHVDTLRIVDSHEHTVSEEERIQLGADPFRVFLSIYASSDLKSAGLSIDDYAKLIDTRRNILDRWKLVEPYWNQASNTGYFTSVRTAIRDIYGIDDVNESTIQTLAERMRLANKRGLYKWVLKDKAKIDVAIIDNDYWDDKGVYHYYLDVDRDFFAPVMRLEDFIIIRGRDDIRRISEKHGTPIHTLRDLETALELTVEKLLDKIVALKIVLAYNRSIFFDKVTFDEAEKVFNKVLSSKTPCFAPLGDMTFGTGAAANGIRPNDQISIEEGRDLQDYMVHKILRLASKYSLPVQVHTGLQEGNLNSIRNSNPELLTNLFIEYYDVVFDVFHGSYPWTRQLTVLAKNFPNVYIDMCWLHIISPVAAREALSEW